MQLVKWKIRICLSRFYEDDLMFIPEREDVSLQGGGSVSQCLVKDTTLATIISPGRKQLYISTWKRNKKHDYKSSEIKSSEAFLFPYTFVYLSFHTHGEDSSWMTCWHLFFASSKKWCPLYPHKNKMRKRKTRIKLLLIQLVDIVLGFWLRKPQSRNGMQHNSRNRNK